MTRLVLATLALLAVLFGASAARAQDEAQTSRARAHYEAGRALYSLGRYDDALREFMSGHQLAPRPRFLLNMGQCYRKLGQPEQAKEMYTLYLRDPAARDSAEREQVVALLAEATRAAAEAPPRPTPTPPPNTPPPNTPPPNTPPPPVITAVPETTATVAPAPVPPRRGIRRHWWVFPVVGAVVVGVALGVGLGLGLEGACPSSGGLGCIDSRPSP